jgi:hypothetical protein
MYRLSGHLHFGSSRVLRSKLPIPLFSSRPNPSSFESFKYSIIDQLDAEVEVAGHRLSADVAGFSELIVVTAQYGLVPDGGKKPTMKKTIDATKGHQSVENGWEKATHRPAGHSTFSPCP